VSARASWLLGLCCALAACSFDDHVKHCAKDAECNSDQECYRGFCIARDAAATADSDAASHGKSSSSSRSGSGGKVGSTSTASTAAGAKASAAGGGGSGARAGAAASPTSAAGSGTAQAVPAGPAQMATGECTDGDELPCLVAALGPAISEACVRGTQRCSGKVWGGCIAAPVPAIEQCNGIDDDCDNKLDEVPDVDCFPDGQTGCTKQSDGRWNCQGMCAVGKQTCTQGKLSECTGYTKPAMEVCTPAGMQAVDENCNGMTDENCACNAAETRSCYSGPEGTLNVGKCVAGMQTCSNGALGPCMNAVTPGTETCANQGSDDDCNGKADDIPNLGSECVVANASGPCRTGKYQCEAGKAELACVPANMPAKETCNNVDDDCNGKVDDTFDLMSDAKNCGACGKTCGSDEACCSGSCLSTKNDANNCGGCGMKCAAASSCNGGKCKDSAPPPPPPPMDAGTPPPMPGTCQPACGAGQTCCNGSCVDTKSDIKNCGACGSACSGTQPGCCSGKCVDLVSNSNCGQCGRDCSLLTNGGLTCTCTKAGDGSIACTGPVLNVCL
jgi:hypothetical protein